MVKTKCVDAQVEEEIATLRHVLASKVKASQELKRKLGFSVWKEFQDDMSQGIRNVKESNVWVKQQQQVGRVCLLDSVFLAII